MEDDHPFHICELCIQRRDVAYRPSNQDAPTAHAVDVGRHGLEFLLPGPGFRQLAGDWREHKPLHHHDVHDHRHCDFGGRGQDANWGCCGPQEN